MNSEMSYWLRASEASMVDRLCPRTRKECEIAMDSAVKIQPLNPCTISNPSAPLSVSWLSEWVRESVLATVSTAILQFVFEVAYFGKQDRWWRRGRVR